MSDEAGGDSVGGDPVCWLHQLCPDCGAVPTGDEPATCWRCGASLGGAEEPDGPAA